MKKIFKHAYVAFETVLYIIYMISAVGSCRFPSLTWAPPKSKCPNDLFPSILQRVLQRTVSMHEMKPTCHIHAIIFLVVEFIDAFFLSSYFVGFWVFFIVVFCDENKDYEPVIYRKTVSLRFFN